MPRKPRPESYPEQAYPSLEDFRCERRTFLRRLAMGVAAVGAGRLLSGCYASTDIDGRPDSELHTVRLPSSGWAGAYLSRGEYLTFHVVFTTYSAAMAAWFEENPSEAMTVCTNTLSGFGCEDVESRAARRALRSALEDHWVYVATDPRDLIEDLDLVIDSCEISVAPDGVAPGPHYP
jgi:hypothetical protein